MDYPDTATGSVSSRATSLSTADRLLDTETAELSLALRQASELLAYVLGAEKVDAYLYEPLRGSLFLVGKEDTPAASVETELAVGPMRVPVEAWASEVFRTGEPYLTGGEDSPDGDGLARRQDAKSVVAVPLTMAGERRGVLAALDSQPDRFSEEDLNLLAAVAKWVGTVAQRTEMRARVAAARARRTVTEELLAHQAFHDPLTDLPNRTLLMDRLQHALARTARRADFIAVLFLDLDRLKYVNDSWGHDAGDQLLIAVAARLKSCVRPEDTVARLGGDEFIVVLDQVADAADAVRVAERIKRVLAPPISLGDQQVFVTASIGVALGRHERDRAADLLRHADLAMYRAKQKGKARYEVHDVGLSVQASRRLELERDLRRALQREELRLFYQPKVDLATGRIVRLEALLRWEHPEKGLVMPDEFIGLAEETGLIVPIGRWVLRRSYEQVSEWRRLFPSAPPLGMSTNVSAREFQQLDLVSEIAGVMDELSVEARGLQLEITESVLLDDLDGAADTLRRLKELGVGLSLDDFGTGYTSFSYLKSLPIDVLKIDRSFVAGLGHNPQDGAIVQAMITLARSFGAEVQAEGIETPEQLVQLQALGCDVGQGYLFARPLPAGEAGALIATGRVAAVAARG